MPGDLTKPTVISFYFIIRIFKHLGLASMAILSLVSGSETRKQVLLRCGLLVIKREMRQSF